MMKKTVLAVVTVSMLGLAGCSAVHTAVAKRNLDVQTKMSETIFLEPAAERTVYLQIRNTSTEQDLSLEPKLRQALQNKGMTISTNPDTAQYWIQANVLSVGKMNLPNAENTLISGYGAGAFGAAAAAGVVGYNSSSGGAALGAGLVGVAADAMVEDTNYTMVTDLQIAEKAPKGVTVTTDNIAMLKQGTSGGKVQTSTAQGDRHKYQTRVVSNANQMNLEFKDAKTALEDQLSKSVSGIF